LTKSSAPDPRRFAAILAVLHLALALCGVLRHEMWRDELQAWMVADRAHSVPQLFANLRYEGNPVLWHSLLFGLSSFTSNPLAMQLLHVLIASAFVYLLARYGPFTRVQAILFAAGYFALFEYALISRGYGLGVLLAFAFCAVFEARYRRPILLGALLFLLANTTVYGLIIALCLGGLLALDVLGGGLGREPRPAGRAAMLAGAALLLLGALLSVLQILPEPDNTFTGRRFFSLAWHPARFRAVLGTAMASYLPIPEPADPHFWETVWLKRLLGSHGAAFASGALLIAALLSFLRSAPVLAFWAASSAGLLGIYYYTSMIHQRYSGHLFVVFLIACWLAARLPRTTWHRPALGRLAGLGDRIRTPLLGLLLLANLVGGVVAFAKDWQLPFSGSAEAARFLERQGLDEMPIVGTVDFMVSPLAALLERDIYYPERGEWGSFIIWDDRRRPKLDYADVWKALRRVLDETGGDVLLVLHDPPQALISGQETTLAGTALPGGIEVRLLTRVERSVVEREKYHIYRARSTRR
jgi:hypothetical protein